MTTSSAFVAPSDLSDHSQGFLTHPSTIETGLPHALALHIRYETERFSPVLFDALNVEFPEQLETSVPKRQAEYLAGRCLGQMALKHFGQPLTHIGRQDTGAPQWPDGVSGSFSHSKGHCVCLAVNAPQALPGIDIEGIASERALTAILSKCLTPNEHDWVQHQNDMPLAELATLIFSAKESLYKMLFPVVQRYFDFGCAALVSLPEAGCLQLELTQDLHPSLCGGQKFNLKFDVTKTHVLTWGIAWP